MTTANETFSETLSDEELAAQIDGGDLEEEVSKPTSVEDSIVDAIIELEADEAKTDENSQGGKGKDDQKPDLNTSEAARILAKSKGQGKGGKRQTFEAQELAQRTQAAAPQAETFQAPQGWDQEAKAEFAALPPLTQKQSLAFWKRMDAHFTHGSQELARGKQKYGSLEEVEQYYKPHLDQHGLNFAEGTRQLWGSHYEIANPQTKLQGLDKVLRANGVTPEQLYQYRQGQGGQGQQQFQQQQNYQQSVQNPLTPEQIRSTIRQELQQVQQHHAINSDAEELQQLRNAVGPNGQALYPELWDNQNLQSNYWNVGYLQRVQPLVEYERKNHPGISVVEATKRAVQLLRLRDGQFQQNGIPSPSIPRLPTNEETIAKARAANVSIRGRGNGATPTTSSAKRGESVEESLRRSIEELSNGRQ